MRQHNLSRYFQFFLIVLAAGAIYPIMYLRTQYQETILSVFHLTSAELNNAYSILGLSFVFGYIPSGLISDRFTVKWLIVISLLGTSACGFWFALLPDARSVLLIFSLWGFFSVFTFWSAHMKMVKMLARSQEEGRFFGILDGGRGVVEAVLASIALAIFATIHGADGDAAGNEAALVGVIRFYAIFVLISAILVALFIKREDQMITCCDNDTGKPAEAEKFHFADAIKLLGKKSVFLMGIIIFMGYSVYWSVYYLGGFLQSSLGIDALTVGSVMVLVSWMRPVGGFIGGFLADRIGRARTVLGAIIGASVLLGVVSAVPLALSPFVFYPIIVLLGAFLYAIRGTFWSLLGDAGVKAAVMGSAIGVISFIGYLPDIVLPQVNSFFHTIFAARGTTAYFLFSVALGMLGTLLVLVYEKITMPCAQSNTDRQEINHETN